MNQPTVYSYQDWNQLQPLPSHPSALPGSQMVELTASEGSSSAVPSSLRPDKRVLFISYAFPPTGGVGVQRAAKFVKYLPGYGWNPTVLTVANPSMPIRDEQLNCNIGADTRVIRARTWEPNYAFKKAMSSASGDGIGGSPQRSAVSIAKRWIRRLALRILLPDPQVLWNGPAYRAAVKALREQQHAAIFVTAPPFSSLLLAERLKQLFDLPLVVDFRDEWLIACRYLENYAIGERSLRRHEALMRRVLLAADAVITTTPGSKNELQSHCQQVGSTATCYSIFNGFDPDDFASLSTASHPDTNQDSRRSNRLQIIYIGTLWRLTNIEPLIQALELLDHESSSIASQIELILIGRRTAEQECKVQRLLKTHVTLSCYDPMPHDQALAIAASADWLLQLGSDEASAERVVSAKLFEYLAMRKNILSIVPQGDAQDLLSHCGHTTIFAPTEPKRLADWLFSAANDRHQAINSRIATTDLTPFTRRYLTSSLAAVLSSCVALPVSQHVSSTPGLQNTG